MTTLKNIILLIVYHFGDGLTFQNNITAMSQKDVFCMLLILHN